MKIQFNPEIDLKLERTLDVPADLIFEAWTNPEHLKHWFCPRPWQTVDAKIDATPGGIFYTVMQSPEGDKFPGTGCFLVVEKNKRLAWTDAMLPGFRPKEKADHPMGFFTAVLDLEQLPNGSTKYTAYAFHKDAQGKKLHEEMGFHEGWGTVVDQLGEYLKAKMKK